MQLFMQHEKNYYGGAHNVLLVVAAEKSEGLPPSIRRCFSHEVKIGPLTEEKRAEMISQCLQGVSELLSDVCEMFDLFYFVLYASGCNNKP